MFVSEKLNEINEEKSDPQLNLIEKSLMKSQNCQSNTSLNDLSISKDQETDEKYNNLNCAQSTLVNIDNQYEEDEVIKDSIPSLPKIIPQQPCTNSTLKDQKMLDDLFLTAQSFSILDCDTNKIILSMKGRKQREIASLTKIMTLMVVCKLLLEEIVHLSDKYIVSKIAAGILGTTADLKAGDQLELIDLLYGMMLPSGNDAAYCLAESIGKILLPPQDEEELNLSPEELEKYQQKQYVKCFIQQMNNLAKSYNLMYTKYNSVHGLMNKNNKSTSSDQARLSALAMQNQLICQIVKTKEYVCRVLTKSGKCKIVKWENTNKLLDFKYCLGLKTGITPSAGPCFSSYFEVQDRKFVIIVLKTEKTSDRFLECKKLFDYLCLKLGFLSDIIEFQLKTSKKNVEKEKSQEDCQNQKILVINKSNGKFSNHDKN